MSSPTRSRRVLPRAALGKDPPTVWPEGNAGLAGRRMLDRQLDFNAMAAAADLQFDAPRARDPAAGRHRAGDAAAAPIAQFDIVRAEMEQGTSVRRMAY